MAYTHSKYEVEIIPATAGGASIGGQANPTAIQNGLNLTVTTVCGSWGPGYVPHFIRGAALVRQGAQATGAFTGGPVGVRFEADITTPGTATHLFTISMPSGAVGHTAVYHTPTYQIELKPGMVCEVHATTAATVGVYAKGILYVEPRWEEAENVTTMQAAT